MLEQLKAEKADLEKIIGTKVEAIKTATGEPLRLLRAQHQTLLHYADLVGMHIKELTK